MSKVFIIDVAKCSGCYNCQLACKDEHCGNDWKPYAASQPDIGQFWMKLEENVRGTIPKVKVHYVPKLCNHCEKPVCKDVCPQDAVSIREDGLVIVRPDQCNGCKKCAETCPYDAIYFNDETKTAQKCTGCAHLLDQGYKAPRCADACPTDALMFGEEEDFTDLIRGATRLSPEKGLGPKVYYLNVPGQFIAGTVFDAAEREVVIGAKCRAVTGGRIYETESDAYGDFWFKDLPVARYDVTIDAQGFTSKYFYDVDTEACVNIGDIPMDKQE